MSSISVTKLYDQLSAIMGKEMAENLTTFIEEKTKTQVDNQSSLLATKNDLHEEVSRIELKLGDLKAYLEVKISDSKSEMIKWMFIFWAGQIVATFGFILLFLKK